VAAALQADPVRSDWTRQHEWSQLDAAKVTVPTLLIHGEFDALTPLEAQSTFFNGLATSDKPGSSCRVATTLRSSKHPGRTSSPS
jgi:pimeloyl-ACP methyl ester carboxylesterase